MKHSTGKPTKTDVARFEQLRELGCIACMIGDVYPPCGPPEVHHLLSGNKRRGHAYTIPLGAWHHRGAAPAGMSKSIAKLNYGPSLADNSKQFRATYGSDDELHLRTNEQLSVAA